MWQDFKKFISQGNVLDLAVAVVIGTAFGTIVSSLVDGIIMPLVGVMLGGVSFENLVLQLGGDARLEYGMFIQSVVDFFIIACSIFLFVRLISSLKSKKAEEEKEEVAKIDEKTELLREIRNLLKEQK